MKKTLSVILASAFFLLLAAYLATSAFAENGQVTYSGNAGEFIFAPGSAYSPTDLFPELKDVMPGDTLLQELTLKNNADNKAVVKFYLLSVTPVEDLEFLSQLRIGVSGSVAGDQTFLFDSPADVSPLSDRVWLGTLYQGGQVDITVLLTVPTSMDNDFQKRVGKIDWVFAVEEYPADEEIGKGSWEKGSEVGKIVNNIIPSYSVEDVYVDGKLVPRDSYVLYTGEEGQTVIKFDPKYLEKLALGAHTVSVKTSDGVLHDVYILTILEKGHKPPKTGDDTSLTLWIVIAAAALLLSILLLLWYRKSRKKEEQSQE